VTGIVLKDNCRVVGLPQESGHNYTDDKSMAGAGNARGIGKRRVPGPVLTPLACAVALAFAGPFVALVQANPTGAQVAAGAASFQTSGKTLTVTNTPGTILNWSSFSIAPGEVTRFQQQSALSAVLNRVTGGNPSSILGTLSSNGRVFLVNPHGIVFGQGSVINTAGFVASTLNISDADFLAGRMKFEGGGHGVLRNEGAIQAAGDIFLVGPQIENAGLIKSDNGSVLLAAGQSVTITSPDAHGVQFALQAPTDSALNLGVIEAKNAAGMFAGTLKHSGDIRVTSASVDASGRVVLAAQKDAILDGNATINVDNSAGKGGAVQITGERVGLFDNATVTARGSAGGGEILVGGDYQGGNPEVRNAARTFVGAGVQLDASATSSGDGGKIIVWADDVTRYFGNAAVRGGAHGGNGGLVEVSGKNALVFDGRVGLEAVNGRAGTLLLDPLNITVQAGAGTLDGELSVPGDPLLAFGEPDNVTTGTLSVASLQAFTTGTVELQANNNITFDAAVTMQSGVSLKAAAMNNVNVNAGITTSGGGVVRLEADTDQSGAGVVNLGTATINAPLIIGDTGKEFSGNTNTTGNFTFGGNSQVFGVMNHGAGTISVAAGQTLTLTGGMNWTAGVNIFGPGTVTLPAGQTLAMTGFGNHALVNATLNNNGTLTSQIGGTALLVNDGSVFNNAGVYRFLGGDTISRNSGAGTFNNTGVVEGVAGNSQINNVTFTNVGGTLDSGTGILELNAGGSHSGALTMQGNNVRLNGGTHSFADGTTIAGILNVTGGGTASFGTVAANGLVNYTGGGFNVTAGDTLTLNAGMNWSEGFSIAGPGTVTLPAGQTLATAGGGGDRVLVNVTFNNNGTFDSGSNGSVLVNDSSVFNNAGLYRFLNVGNFISRNSGAGTFSNTGTIQVGGAFPNNINNVTFTNTGGTLDSGTGTLNLNSGGSHSGALTMQGNNVFLAGGTHSFADGTTVAGRLNVAGGTASFGSVNANGLVTYGGGGFNVTTADTLTLNGGMNWTSGDVSGPGTIVLPVGQTLAMSTAGNRAMVNLLFNNNGTVTSQIGTAGQLLMNDSTVFNNAGTYRFLDSSVINRNSGAGAFNNTGEIEVVGAFNGFVSGVALTNTGGTLDSGGGMLRLDASGAHSGALTLQGSNVQFNAGTHTFADGTTVAGQINVTGGTTSFGTVAVNGLVNYSGGALNVTAGDSLTLNGGMNWSGGGNLSGPGAITLPAGQTLAMTSVGGMVGLVFNNNGTVTSQLSGSSLLVNDGSVFNNAGVYRFLTGDLINRNSGAGTFNNTGEIEVGGAFTASMANVTFTNTGGTLDSGTGTLNLNAGGSHSGALVMQGTAVQISGGTHNFADATTVAGQLNVSAGGIANFGTVTTNGLVNYSSGGSGFNVTAGDTLTLNGGMNWSNGGNVSGPGTITLPAGQTLAMGPGGTGNRALVNVTLNNDGLVTSQIGGNNLIINDGSVFNNAGVFRFLSGDTITRNSGTGTLNNTGTLQVNGAFTVPMSNVVFTNTGGTLDSGPGTLNLDAGGAHSGALTLLGGNVRFNSGTHNFADGTTVAGALNLTGGTWNFGTVATNDVVTISGGSGLNVTAGDTLTLNGGLNWTVGVNISGPGVITLPAGQTLAMTGGGNRALVNATFNNNGTLTSQLGGQGLLLNDGSVFNNAGMYRFLSGDFITRNSGVSTFNNTGELEVGGAFTATMNNVTFNNTSGTLDSGTGIFNLDGGGTHSGVLTMQGASVRLNGGTHGFADGATVAGQFNVSGGTTSMGTVIANGLVNYTGGALNVTAGDTLTLNAGMNWGAGANISGPGAVTLPAGQTMTLTNTSTHALVNATFNNNGIVTSQIGGQNLLINDGSVFNNAGVYRFLDTHAIARNSGAGSFNNTGTLQVVGAFTGTVNDVVFSNTGGTLDSGAGTLNINVGGAHSGAMTVQGADVRFNTGTHTFTTASFAGTGAINLQGADFSLNNSNWNRSFNLTSGTVTIPAATTTTVPVGANIAINHAVGGTGTLLNQGTVDLSGGSLAGALNNQGALNLASGNTTVSGGITMVSGAINVAAANTLNVAGTGVDWQGGTLAGTGTYNLTGGLAITGGGARVLNGPTLNLGATTLDGSLTVQSGALNFGGIAAIGPAATLEMTGGTVTGALAVDVQGLLKMNGGVLNAASLGLVPGATLSGSGGTINAPVVNGGTVAVGASPGTLVVNGNYSQTPTGVLNVELGGTTQGVNYDLLQVNGTASLGGTMNVAMFGGFTGAVGNVFDVITYTSRTGDFTTINFPPGFGMSAAPNATFYQLALASVPAVAAASGGAGEATILKLPAGETKILNDKFLATVDAGKQPEEEEKKGAVLECK